MTELVNITCMGSVTTCSSLNPLEYTGNLGRRKVSTLEKLPILISDVTGSYDGVYQGSKFIRGCSLAAQVWWQHAGSPVADLLGRQMKQIADFTQAAGVFNRFNVFTSGAYTKFSVRKNVYCVCLAIKGVLDATKWLVSHSILSLGRAAALLARVPLLNQLGRCTLGGMADAFLIFGCFFNVIDNALKIAREKTKSHVREWASIVNDVGKVACVTLSFMYFTYTFAAISIVTAGSALFKVGYEDWRRLPNTVPVQA